MIAGYSMGGITVAAWPDRHPASVERHAAVAALINTATGDLVRESRLLAGPSMLADGRVRLARLLGPLAAAPLPIRFMPYTVARMLVGGRARPGDYAFIRDMLASTPVPTRVGFGD